MKGVLKRVETNLSRRSAIAEADERQSPVRNKYASAETVTEVDLKLLDDAEPGSSDEGEYDPYNSGSFDTSKMWSSRSHK